MILVNSTAVTSGSASAAISLSVGDNVINVAVTAEDGTTEKAYTVTVTRDDPLSADADLSGFSLSVGSLSPSFVADTVTYTASVDFTTTSITVTPILADSNASVTVNGEATASGNSSSVINLAEGDNTITLIVLAEDATTSKTYTVVVNRQPATSFAQEAYIKASNAEGAHGTLSDGDEFGTKVVLSGNTMAVSAPQESGGSSGINGDENNDLGRYSGAVYVFVRDPNVGWSQQAYIKASNVSQVSAGFMSWDRFGYSIALDGDTLVVGAPMEDGLSTGVNGDQTQVSSNNGGDAGAVYVFTRDQNDSWSQQAYVKAANTDPQRDDGFGFAVDISGDTIAVSTEERPSVSIFTRDGLGIWSQEAYLSAQGQANIEQHDKFGFKIALSGDILAVSANTEDSSSTGIDGDQSDNSASQSGAVLVYSRQGTSWTQEAYIKASNTEKDDYFGYDVALDGNLLAVSAFAEDSSASGINGDQSDNLTGYAGAVYVYTRDTQGTWSQEAYIKASNPDSADVFGVGIALSGSRLAVGARGESSNATGFDGDQQDNSMALSGAAYLFERQSGIWSQIAYVKASNPDSGDEFAWELDLDGSLLAVGSKKEDSSATGIDGIQGDNSAENAGATYVYKIQ